MAQLQLPPVGGNVYAYKILQSRRCKPIRCAAQLRSVAHDGGSARQKSLGDQLAALHDERDRALQLARKCVEKRTRLAIKLEGIDEAALGHMKAQQEDEARRLVQDKIAIKRAFVMAQQRSEANLQLASKLEQLIGELGSTVGNHAT